MPNYQKHSIIIPIYNAPKEVAMCFASLENSLDFDTVELILLDDASMPETKKIIEDFCERHSTVKHVCHKENQGYLKTVNEGLAMSAGEVITFLNSDTTIPKDFSSRVLACFNHKENVGVASPILAKGIPFSVPMPQHSSPLDVGLMDAKIKGQAATYPIIVFPDGACFSVSRACFEKVGFFDTCYQSGYFEELDFSMRAVEMGFDTVYIDNLYVYHRAHASFSKESTKKLMQRNKQIFMEKWGEKYQALHKAHPKNAHKKRIYSHFYSVSHYYFVTGLLKLSKFIPVSSVRRKIRHRYQ